MARAKPAAETEDADDEVVGAARSGWCSAGQCLPSPYTNGCRGTFSSFKCSCPCHNGNVPERALRVQEAARARAAAAEAEEAERAADGL